MLLGEAPAERLTPNEHVRLLEYLCNELLDTGIMRVAVEKRAEEREELGRERREEHR